MMVYNKARQQRWNNIDTYKVDNPVIFNENADNKKYNNCLYNNLTGKIIYILFNKIIILQYIARLAVWCYNKNNNKIKVV